MKALHMLGEVILGSEDFNTVSAVVEVGLGMVIVLVIRSRSRKDFFFVKMYFSFLRPILHKPGLTRVLSDSKIASFATDSELFRKVIFTACV